MLWKMGRKISELDAAALPRDSIPRLGGTTPSTQPQRDPELRPPTKKELDPAHLPVFSLTRQTINDLLRQQVKEAGFCSSLPSYQHQAGHVLKAPFLIKPATDDKFCL